MPVTAEIAHTRALLAMQSEQQARIAERLTRDQYEERLRRRAAIAASYGDPSIGCADLVLRWVAKIWLTVTRGAFGQIPIACVLTAGWQ